MDNLKPVYNTLKIAGSSSGYKHTQESKDKRSLSLKGKYTGTDSPLYGRYWQFFLDLFLVDAIQPIPSLDLIFLVKSIVVFCRSLCLDFMV